MEYALNPKEIPLSEDEVILCEGCGHPISGLRSTRFFDYEPLLNRYATSRGSKKVKVDGSGVSIQASQSCAKSRAARNVLFFLKKALIAPRMDW
jgi:hypothetical protein